MEWLVLLLYIQTFKKSLFQHSYIFIKEIPNFFINLPRFSNAQIENIPHLCIFGEPSSGGFQASSLAFGFGSWFNHNYWADQSVGGGGGSWQASSTLTLAQLVFVNLQLMWGGGGSGAEAHGNEPYELEGVEVIAPKWYQKAWKWVKGINFHFDFDFEVTYGVQVGAEGKVLNKSAGVDVNLVSMVLFSFNAKGEAGLDGNTEGTTKNYYFGKDNIDKLSQGISASVGVAQGKIERSWEAGLPNQNSEVKISGGALIFEGEQIISDSPIPHPTRTNANVGMKNFGAVVRFLIGIDINVKVGISHD